MVADGKVKAEWRASRRRSAPRRPSRNKSSDLAGTVGHSARAPRTDEVFHPDARSNLQRAEDFAGAFDVALPTSDKITCSDVDEATYRYDRAVQHARFAGRGSPPSGISSHTLIVDDQGVVQLVDVRAHVASGRFDDKVRKYRERKYGVDPATTREDATRVYLLPAAPDTAVPAPTQPVLETRGGVAVPMEGMNLPGLDAYAEISALLAPHRARNMWEVLDSRVNGVVEERAGSASPPVWREKRRELRKVDCVRPSSDDRTWWEMFKDGLAKSYARFCCCLGDDLEDVNAYGRVKRMVSEDMTTSVGVRVEMSGEHEVRKDMIEQVVDDHELSASKTGLREVVVVPAFIAACVVALRMKLGEGATDRRVPGNIELVKAETAKLLREYNVRLVDAALHQKYIIKAFFNDDTHYRVPDARARLASKSRFVKWLLKGEEKPTFDY